MAITATDILFKFSVAAAAGNTTAGTAPTSLGIRSAPRRSPTPACTTSSMPSRVTRTPPARPSTGASSCTTTTAPSCGRTWSCGSPAKWRAGAAAAISVDTTGVTAIGSASPQMKTIVDENTAPATQTFTAPTTKPTGLAIGNIPAGSCAGIWIRRTAANSAALDNDGVTIRCEGDTAA